MKTTLNRRSLLKRSFYTIVSFEIIALFIGLFQKKTSGEKIDTVYDAGDVTLFDKDHVYPFGSAHFYLSCLQDGGLFAISSRCTHLGCQIQFNSEHDRFICPCHASAFNKKGEVLSPPATQPLDIYPITIQDNRVLVHINTPVKRSRTTVLPTYA